jgi:opacity protein-like surface antigen
MKHRFLVVAAAVMAVAGAARAENVYTDRARHWDFSVQTRYTDAKEFDGEHGSKLSLDDDLGWGFAFGYHVNERFNIGMLMSWRSIGYNATFVDATDATNVSGYASWLDTGTFALTAEWNLLPKRFTPYVSGVLGWTMIDTNIVADYQTGCWWDPWWGYVCDTYAATYGTDEATYAAGAGLRLELTPQFFIRGGYEKNWINDATTDGFDIIRVDIGAIY